MIDVVQISKLRANSVDNVLCQEQSNYSHTGTLCRGVVENFSFQKGRIESCMVDAQSHILSVPTMESLLIRLDILNLYNGIALCLSVHIRDADAWNEVFNTWCVQLRTRGTASTFPDGYACFRQSLLSCKHGCILISSLVYQMFGGLSFFFLSEVKYTLLFLLC